MGTVVWRIALVTVSRMRSFVAVVRGGLGRLAPARSMWSASRACRVPKEICCTRHPVPVPASSRIAGWREYRGRHRAGGTATRDTVSGSALSARATARLVAVGAVLCGLFFMHGLAAQGCAGGAGKSASSMAHSVTVATAMSGPDRAVGAVVATASRPLAHSASRGDAGESAELCMSTPPPPGWVGLLALLLGVSVVGPASVLDSPDRATRPSNQRRRAPPLAGSTLLMNLCVSRR